MQMHSNTGQEFNTIRYELNISIGFIDSSTRRVTEFDGNSGLGLGRCPRENSDISQL